jgi:hypothetical protein
VMAGGETSPFAAGEDSVDGNGIGLVAFNAESGAAASRWSSSVGLLGDIAKDGNPRAGSGSGSSAWSGNSSANSPGGGNSDSGGMGASAGGGMSTGGASSGGASSSGNAATSDTAQTTLSHSSSTQGATPASAPSGNSQGTLRRTVAKPENHREQDTGLGNDFVSVYDEPGGSHKSVSSFLGDEPGGNNGNGGPHDAGTGDAIDPTTGKLFGPWPNGGDGPPQGEDFGGTGFSDVGGGNGSGDGGGNGTFNELVEPQSPGSGTIQGINIPSNATVPEPGTFLLLGTGLLGIGLLVRRKVAS